MSVSEGEARKGVVVYTTNGNLKHEDATEWVVSRTGILDVFNGTDLLASYSERLWLGVAFDGVTKPA